HPYGPTLTSAVRMSEPTNFTKEEVLPIFTSATPTDPAALEWAPIAGIFRGTVRLRMHITPGNLSEELLDAIRHTRYPDADVPEVLGLRRDLETAGGKAGVALRVDPGPRDMQTGFVAFFQPFTVGRPVAPAK